MSDIKWRNLEDVNDFTMLKNYPKELIIVKTTITTRLCYPDSIEYIMGKGWWLNSSQERLTGKFAFLNI